MSGKNEFMPDFKAAETLYHNPLSSESDVADWIREGRPVVAFEGGKLRLSNAMDPSLGQAANYLFWAPPVVEGSFRASWKFRPLEEPGLAMFWFCAAGRKGEDLFDPSLARREGNYRQYHSGDINAYHLSYFRRKNPDERGFHTCNMRKSHGFHLVCQGADPIPDVGDVQKDFEMEVVKLGNWIRFAVDGLVLFTWKDDGSIGGPPHTAGRFGFRQMAPLVAAYSDFLVESIRESK
ncbi:MAG: DUF1961 family protein [Oceanipulchritudo sp.]